MFCMIICQNSSLSNYARTHPTLRSQRKQGQLRFWFRCLNVNILLSILYHRCRWFAQNNVYVCFYGASIVWNLPHAFTPRFWDITSTSFFLSQDKVTSSVTFWYNVNLIWIISLFFNSLSNMPHFADCTFSWNKTSNAIFHILILLSKNKWQWHIPFFLTHQIFVSDSLLPETHLPFCSLRSDGPDWGWFVFTYYKQISRNLNNKVNQSYPSYSHTDVLHNSL